MGRKKKPADQARTAWLQVQVRPVFRDWAKATAEANDESLSEMVVRLLVKEGKRLKQPPAPDR